MSDDEDDDTVVVDLPAKREGGRRLPFYIIFSWWLNDGEFSSPSVALAYR